MVEASVPPRSPTVALNCEVMTEPIPWTNTIKVLELMPRLQKGWVLESSLVRRRTREWPEPFRPNETYACKIGNFSDLAVFDVETVLGLTFKKAVKADSQLNSKSLKSAETIATQQHSISIPEIASHTNLVFYVRNPTQYFVLVSLPDLADMEFQGSEGKRSVKLQNTGQPHFFYLGPSQPLQ